MDKLTILAVTDFSRTRLLAILDTLEKSGQDVAKVLAWRSGAGRAHIGWQAMHCAATHDRYLNKLILNKPVSDELLCTDFGGGSTPRSWPSRRDCVHGTSAAVGESVGVGSLTRRRGIRTGGALAVNRGWRGSGRTGASTGRGAPLRASAVRRSSMRRSAGMKGVAGSTTADCSPARNRWRWARSKRRSKESRRSGWV